MSEGEGLWVESSRGRLRARLMSDRLRSVILSVEDGQVARIMKGSCRVREDPHVDRELAVWLARNRRSWEHLRAQTHPGLLRVGERVVDNYGDEGYLCQRLTVRDPEDPLHPARSSLRDFLRCAIRLSRAVGVMHRAGYVHGDITPANVCFHDGLPVLIDFETMASVSGGAQDARDRHACCTPHCCSPEQAMSEPVTPASDVYCLGLTLLSWISERSGVGHAHDPIGPVGAICRRGSARAGTGDTSPTSDSRLPGAIPARRRARIVQASGEFRPLSRARLRQRIDQYVWSIYFMIYWTLAIFLRITL